MAKLRTTGVVPAYEKKDVKVPGGEEGVTIRGGALTTRDVERVMCVIDNSGSMEEGFGDKTRMEAVVEALWEIVDASSRAMTAIGLIAFNTKPQVESAITQNFSQVKARAGLISPRGGTYYAPAISSALLENPHRIILLSDGEASDKDAALAQAYAAKARGIKIDTVAVGDRGVTLLQEISEITGGVYTFCDNIAKLRDTFLKLETRARLQLEHKS